MTHGWITVVLTLENLLVCAVYVGAFARITWRNRHNTFLFLGGLVTTAMFAVVDLTALMLFLQEGV
jgi:hypothetical protein